MNYLKNHCWCSSSHWDNTHFDCQIIVSLSSYEDGYTEDWEALTHKVEVFSQEKMDDHNRYVDYFEEKYPDKDTTFVRDDKSRGMREVSRLKPEVMSWLEDNIKDTREGKGWCVGSDDYVANDGTGLCVFMQRRSDAMKFIKTWSKWKKPISYIQYFTDIRKTLDLTTLKYTTIEY